MQELVANCPRCHAQEHTFIVRDHWHIDTNYNWQKHYESYAVCKKCKRGTIFHLSQKNYNDEKIFASQSSLSAYAESLNHIMNIEGYVSLRNFSTEETPAHVPNNIDHIFQEGAQSVAGNCPNAAAAMFRLCIDLVTKGLLPEDSSVQLTQNVRKNLYYRLEWLFDNKVLPPSLKELAECIREDGNDGVHDGTITLHDVEDLLDFTTLLLETVYTVPHRLQEANVRREARRQRE